MAVSKTSNLLICTLFTLAPNENIFKLLNAKKTTIIKPKDVYLVMNDLQQFDDIYALLHKKAIIQLAYFLLKPLLGSVRQGKGKFSGKEKIFQQTQTQLLLKYLTKFRYIYFRYFATKKQKVQQSCSKKDLNTLAIQGLFLIVNSNDQKMPGL